MLSGRELRRILDGFCPFDEDLNLKPEDEQRTILAANSNNWWESRAFVQAAATGDQSPIIVQFSYNSNRKVGGDPDTVFCPDGVDYTASPVVNGAKANVDWMEMEADAWDADYVGISLDHFKVPKFEPGTEYKATATPIDYGDLLADAIEYINGKGLQSVTDEVDDETFQAYLEYLTSTEYQGFRRDFMDTVSIMDPGWGMIDTEAIPFVLDFAITRDFALGVRQGLGNHEMILEAELGATGTSGDEIEYQPMRGEELEEFAHLAAAFVDYTGAEGISYDIGMKHAAMADETHEADKEKLETVQRTIIEETGFYAAYAQHGGTGAAEVTKGLVGKTNVNTAFLVAGSCARAEHFVENIDEVRAGNKSICGTSVETKIYLEAIYNAAVERYKTTGSWQTGPECREFLVE